MSQSVLALVATGGTIAMQHDPSKGGNVPALDGADLLKLVGGPETAVAVELLDWERLPAVQRGPDGMWDLRSRLAELAEDPMTVGIVVTHGTDTMAEMAYLTRRTVPPRCPIVFTGAMRTSSDPAWDGPRNLHDAVAVATARESQQRGAMVVFAGLILDGRHAVKMHTGAIDAFGAPHATPLGQVGADGVVFVDRPHSAPCVAAKDCMARVPLIPLALGDDGALLDLARPTGDGVVIAAYGRGNVPPKALPAIERWLAEGKPVVLASQCPAGEVGPDYAFEGGGATVLALGVVPAGRRNAAQARLELILSLSAGVPYAVEG